MNTQIDLQKLAPAWQAVQSIAPIAHIESSQEYNQTTELLHYLLDVIRDDNEHPLYSLIEILGDMLEVYEEHLEPHA